jgi:hypothetical protein
MAQPSARQAKQANIQKNGAVTSVGFFLHVLQVPAVAGINRRS